MSLFKNLQKDFEVLKTFGNRQIAAEFEKIVIRWHNSAIVALVNLPNGTGIPMLVAAVSENEYIPPSMRYQALNMLAQVSSRSITASNTLLTVVKQEQLPKFYFNAIASALVGEIVRPIAEVSANRNSQTKSNGVDSIDQNHYSENNIDNWTVKEIDKRLNLLDKLIEANADKNASAPLQRSRNTLMQKLEAIEFSSLNKNMLRFTIQ